MHRLSKWLLSLCLLLLLLAGIYAFLFQWVVPKIAGFAIPGKFKMLPLRQTKTIVRDYLGEPNPISVSSFDEWVNGSSDKQYTLRIYYTRDTIATAYAIRYTYQNRVIHKTYLLDSASVR